MKNKLFETIYYEDFIEVNIEKQELINKLSQLQYTCREDSNGQAIAFYINKKGSFSFNTPQRGNSHSLTHARNCYLKGKVIASKNNTSTIYIEYIRIRAWLIYITTLFITVFLPLALLFGLTWKLLFFIPFAIVSILIDVVFSSKEALNKRTDYEIMKKAMIDKIEAVLNWDK